MMVTQSFEAVVGDEVIVFKTHAANAFDVQAGFDGDDISNQQHVVTLRNQNWRLWMFHAQAVAAMVGQRRIVAIEKHG